MQQLAARPAPKPVAAFGVGSRAHIPTRPHYRVFGALGNTHRAAELAALGTAPPTRSAWRRLQVGSATPFEIERLFQEDEDWCVSRRNAYNRGHTLDVLAYMDNEGKPLSWRVKLAGRICGEKPNAFSIRRARVVLEIRAADDEQPRVMAFVMRRTFEQVTEDRSATYTAYLRECALEASFSTEGERASLRGAS
ncbi:MAG: hypothetical protein Q7J84_12600 [Sulfuricaulis sp.]|nr:hypothetical protein [Sulfuricaulis sp.]